MTAPLGLGELDAVTAWQKARQLTLELYTVSAQEAFAKDTALRDQVRAHCVAILTQLAEGFRRSETGGFTPYLTQAGATLGEVRTGLYTAFDRGHIGKMVFDRLFVLAAETGRQIDELSAYLKRFHAKKPETP